MKPDWLGNDDSELWRKAMVSLVSSYGNHNGLSSTPEGRLSFRLSDCYALVESQGKLHEIQISEISLSGISFSAETELSINTTFTLYQKLDRYGTIAWTLNVRSKHDTEDGEMYDAIILPELTEIWMKEGVWQSLLSKAKRNQDKESPA